MDVFIRVEQRQGEPLFLLVAGINYKVSFIKIGLFSNVMVYFFNLVITLY